MKGVFQLIANSSKIKWARQRNDIADCFSDTIAKFTRTGLNLEATIIQSSEGDVVGHVSWIRVSFVQFDGTPYRLGPSDLLTVEVRGPINLQHTIQDDGINSRIVNFSVNKSGTYMFHLCLNGKRILKEDMCRVYVADVVDTPHCSVSNTQVIAAVNEPRTISVNVVDRYGNAASLAADAIQLVCDPCADCPDYCLPEALDQLVFTATENLGSSGLRDIVFTLPYVGAFKGKISIRIGQDWQCIKSGIVLLSLNGDDIAEVQRNSALADIPPIQSTLLSGTTSKGYTVYVLVTRKRILVRYYYLGLHVLDIINAYSCDLLIALIVVMVSSP